MIERRIFGHLHDGTSVELITIRHAGLELSVTNYGCVIVSLSVADARGRVANVALGYDRLEPYLESSPYFGAFVGRVANRIANARFSIDGRVHNVSPNEPPHHLHGGFHGFDKRVWEAETSGHENAVLLRRRSADGEEGYPGALDAEVTYSIGDHGDVWMRCEATTDAPTHVNLTQHSYFNLQGSGDVLDHRLMIDASTYLPVDRRLIPTGARAPVADTPFDFLQPREIGARLNDDHGQLKIGGGYDHHFVLNRSAVSGDLALAARAFDPSSGRTLEVSTTEPGLQFYSGQVVGHRGFCLEPQHFPDSPNRPEFPSTLLRPGERYRTMTRYAFST
jgi:aldose 1-epimerase